MIVTDNGTIAYASPVLNFDQFSQQTLNRFVEIQVAPDHAFFSLDQTLLFLNELISF